VGIKVPVFSSELGFESFVIKQDCRVPKSKPTCNFLFLSPVEARSFSPEDLIPQRD